MYLKVSGKAIHLHRCRRSSGTQQQYTVNLVEGGTSIITTEQDDIRSGDCVSIEQGDYANIRRVSSVHCEVKTEITVHHASAASDCELAKHELAKADTDDEITMASKKVRILCEDQLTLKVIVNVVQGVYHKHLI